MQEKMAMLKLENEILLAEKANALLKEEISETKAKPKSKTNKSGTGANYKANELAQEQGTLVAFREHGCKCRVWGDRIGTQCSRKATIGDMCKSHNTKFEECGGWKLGFYDEPRPEKWGDVPGTLANHQQKSLGKPVGWKMPEMEYKKLWEKQEELQDDVSVASDKTLAFGDYPEVENVIANMADFADEEISPPVSPPLTSQQICKSTLDDILTDVVNIGEAKKVKPAVVADTWGNKGLPDPEIEEEMSMEELMDAGSAEYDGFQ
jgi:hypothetical protein